MFADIASPATVANIHQNPKVEVNVVDPIVRKGYRFKGVAEVFTSGKTFKRGVALLRERGYATPPGRIRSIVVIEVVEAAAVLSPAYDDGASEQSVASTWLRHHAALRR